MESQSHQSGTTLHRQRSHQTTREARTREGRTAARNRSRHVGGRCGSRVPRMQCGSRPSGRAPRMRRETRVHVNGRRGVTAWPRSRRGTATRQEGTDPGAALAGPRAWDADGQRRAHAGRTSRRRNNGQRETNMPGHRESNRGGFFPYCSKEVRRVDVGFVASPNGLIPRENNRPRAFRAWVLCDDEPLVIYPPEIGFFPVPFLDDFAAGNFGPV